MAAGGRGRQRRQGRLLLALAATGLTCATAGEPPPPHAFPVQELTLPSGLKLVIEQDDVSQVAGIFVIVDAGSVDDPVGKKGIAHVLEHLVFRVPDESGQSVWGRLVRLGAASFNGHTAIERTTYHAFGPRQTLDELVAIVLGRLADPLRGAREAHVAKETSIVAEEINKREGAAASEYLVPELLPPGHPVGRAYADLRRSDPLSLADVRAFADAHYRPERMTVVISGPVPAGWDKTLLAKLPPALRGQESARRAPVRRPVAAFDGPARVESELPPRTAKVFVPELWMAWRAPPATGVAAETARVMARVIDETLSGRLDPDGTNDILDVDCFAWPDSLSTVIGCRFKLRAAADAARIRDESRHALEALADVTLVRIKGRLRWSQAHALQAATLDTALRMETIEGRARVRAELVHAGSPAMISGVLGALEKITVEETAGFAARYLRADAARSVLVVPEEGWAADRRRATPERAAPLSAPAGEGDDGDAVEAFDDDADADTAPPGDPAQLAAITQAPGARAAVVRKLESGLTVIALRRPGLPFVSMILGFHADPQPGDAPGARVAYGRALHWKLSDHPTARGVERIVRHYDDKTFERLSLFSSATGQALDFLSEEADSLHVFWPNPAFDRWVAERASWEATPEGRSARAFRSALFGDHPYHLMPPAAQVQTVTEKQVQTWFDRVRRPANGALVIVGEIDPEGAVRDAGKALSGWTGGAAAVPAAPPPPLVPAARLRAAVVDTRDARRRTADVRFGCFLPPVRTQRDRVVNHLLGELLEDAMFNRMRWDLGVTYARDVDADSARGGTSWFNGRLDVDGKALPEAMQLLHAWLDGDAAPPVDDARLARIRWNAARRSGLANATGQQLAYALFYNWNMGWEPAALDDYPRDLASVTRAEVLAALATCRRSAVISVLAPDPQ